LYDLKKEERKSIMYLEDMQLAMIRIAEYVREDRLNTRSGEISMTANRSVNKFNSSRQG